MSAVKLLLYALVLVAAVMGASGCEEETREPQFGGGGSNQFWQSNGGNDESNKVLKDPMDNFGDIGKPSGK